MNLLRLRPIPPIEMPPMKKIITTKPNVFFQFKLAFLRTTVYVFNRLILI